MTDSSLLNMSIILTRIMSFDMKKSCTKHACHWLAEKVSALDVYIFYLSKGLILNGAIRRIRPCTNDCVVHKLYYSLV